MTPLYPNQDTAQVESDIFVNSNVNDVINSFENKGKPQKNKTTHLNQSQRLVAFKRMNTRERKLYCLQVFFYVHVGRKNTRDFPKAFIMDWIESVFGYQIGDSSLTLYINDLIDVDYLEANQTFYRNEAGQILPGNNNYTLKNVDPGIHAWAEDKPFLPAAKKAGYILSSSSFKDKERRRTISKDYGFSSDDSSVEVKKKKVKNTNPEMIQDPTTWWPNGAAADVLAEQYGPSYCAQEPIVSEFQRLIATDYPEGLPRRLLNYKFIAFAKSTKPLKEQYGVGYMSFEKRRHYNKTHQHAPKTEFPAYEQKTPVERAAPVLEVAKTGEEIQAEIVKITAIYKEIREQSKKEFIALHGVPSSLGSPEGTAWRLSLNAHYDQAIALYRESTKLNE